MKLLEVSLSDGVFRACYNPPIGSSSGTCVLIQSGRVGRYDEPGPESLLYKQLQDVVGRAGIGTMQLDMERREDASVPASEGHLKSRTLRIKRLLKEPSFADYLQRFVLCGVSLGAQSVLQVISEPPDKIGDPAGVVLVGCVVESPVPVMSNLREIHLVYGSRDHIAYVDEYSPGLVAIPPAQYGYRSAEMLVIRPKQTCSVHILEGLGHTLLTGQNEEADEFGCTFLADLICRILS